MIPINVKVIPKYTPEQSLHKLNNFTPNMIFTINVSILQLSHFTIITNKTHEIFETIKIKIIKDSNHLHNNDKIRIQIISDSSKELLFFKLIPCDKQNKRLKYYVSFIYDPESIPYFFPFDAIEILGTSEFVNFYQNKCIITDVKHNTSFEIETDSYCNWLRNFEYVLKFENKYYFIFASTFEETIVVTKIDILCENNNKKICGPKTVVKIKNQQCPRYIKYKKHLCTIGYKIDVSSYFSSEKLVMIYWDMIFTTFYSVIDNERYAILKSKVGYYEKKLKIKTNHCGFIPWFDCYSTPHILLAENGSIKLIDIELNNITLIFDSYSLEIRISDGILLIRGKLNINYANKYYKQGDSDQSVCYMFKSPTEISTIHLPMNIRQIYFNSDGKPESFLQCGGLSVRDLSFEDENSRDMIVGFNKKKVGYAKTWFLCLLFLST